MRIRCFDCGRETEYRLEDWHCPCGGAWEPILSATFNSDKIKMHDYSIWRYGEFLGLDIHSPLKRMGVGWTPLVPMSMFDRKVNLKLEYLSPSCSFKDRGVNAMINQLVHMGVKSVVEDSSGNAGASLAAHAAHFDIPAKIFVPAYASTAKIQQIAVYGAEVIPVPGLRSAAQDAAHASIVPGRAYASHAYNPAYLAGQITVAWELWEQLGGIAPDWIICPVAQGGQLLGYWFGFLQLLNSGLIDHLPHLVAVQSANIAPIYHAWSQNLEDIPAVEPIGQTVAEGAAITKPARGKRLLQALRETDGKVLAIGEDEILTAQQESARLGYFIEPTSALALAGFKLLKDEIMEGDIVVLPLTGSGLKSTLVNKLGTKE